MAETAVGLAIDHLVQLLTNEASLLRGVRSQVSSIKRELEAIQCFLKDADMMADLEEEGNTSRFAGVKLWVKELREVAFQIKDVIDEYKFHLERYPGHGHGFIGSLGQIGRSIVKLKPRYHIASRIQEIKKAVVEISERSKRYGFDSIAQPQGTTNANPSQYISGYDPRKGSIYLEEDDVVGIESPRDELVGWLLNNDQQPRRAVISVVGMGGLGKTTLARKVYDRVKNDFDCYAWITVSHSYQEEELLKNVITQFCDVNKEPLPQGIGSMDKQILTNKVREYLQQKRYVVFFDDVWKKEFWGDIEHALFDNKNGGRIVITTRSNEVVNFCKISSFVHVHELKPLDPENALELFRKRAFQYEVGGCCPSNLEYLSHKIVERCGGLPLAIVAIAGLLSTKHKTIDEWKKLHDNLGSELENNQYLTSITKILSLSYYDLPYHLKCCFLYFGMYPEDYLIKKSRLIRQWIAESFVKPKKDKTLEEVAQEYLTELIDRSLVEVRTSNTDTLIKKGEVCHVHDLLHEVIGKKIEDLSFCHNLCRNESTFKGLVTRRISIVNGSSNVLRSSYQDSQVRSILNFDNSDEILGNSILSLHKKNFKLLKVVDFEDGILDHVHKNIGKLFHLRYLCLRNTKVKMLPRSIGKLVNLETLDVRGTFVVELPAEIKRLRKLRNLLVYNRSYDFDRQFNPCKTKGLRKVQEGIGCLESLQKLSYLEVNEMGVHVIKELGKLTQLRKLGIGKIRSEDGSILFEVIQKMSHLKSLIFTAISEDETFDSEFLISSLPQSLECLTLAAPLRKKLPESITRLQNLQRLAIGWSKFEEDPLKTLKNLHNLSILWIGYDAYIEQIQFEKGVFPKLKKIFIIHLNGLESLVIEEGALPNLELLWLGPCLKLNSVPTGIQHLKQLKHVWFHSISIEFQQSLKPGGHHHHILQHVPHVFIRHRCRGDEQSFETAPLF